MANINLLSDIEIQELYIQNMPLIIKLIGKNYMFAMKQAYRTGVLSSLDPQDAAQSRDLYNSIRLSLRRWIQKGRPGSPRTYIGWGVRNWAGRMARLNSTRIKQMDRLDSIACTRSFRDEIDVDEAVRKLPPRYRKLARLLQRGKSKKRIRAELGISGGAYDEMLQSLEIQLIRYVSGHVHS